MGRRRRRRKNYLKKKRRRQNGILLKKNYIRIHNNYEYPRSRDDPTKRLAGTVVMNFRKLTVRRKCLNVDAEKYTRGGRSVCRGFLRFFFPSAAPVLSTYPEIRRRRRRLLLNVQTHAAHVRVGVFFFRHLSRR